MGNSASASDRALAACATGDVRTLQKVIAFFPAAGPELKLVLDARDKEGRSCLALAAIRNHVAVARLLLQHGADVHYINKTSAKSFTALHEAASRKHEQMVDLLLQYGANPFLANSSGETPMELAVLSGGTKIVQTFERRALFSGQVEMQWCKMLGISNDYKPRKVIIMDHFPCPRPGAALPPTRRQMWIHSTERDDIMPKSRVWLDGAMAMCTPAGNECVLRLAHSHVQPSGNIYTRFSQGYCLFLRAMPRRASASGSEDPWAQLLRLCHVTDAVTVPLMAPLLKGAPASAVPVGLIPPNQQAAGAGQQGRAQAAVPPSAVSAPAMQPVQPPTVTAAAAAGAPYSYPVVSGGVTPLPPPPMYTAGVIGAEEAFQWGYAPAGSQVVAAAMPHSQAYGAAASSTPPRHASSASATSGLGYPPLPHPQGTSALFPYTAAPSYTPPHDARPPHRHPPHQSNSLGGVGLDHTTAMPGESDAAFAARLAALSAGGAENGVDIQALKMAEAALQRPTSSSAAVAGRQQAERPRYPSTAYAGAAAAQAPAGAGPSHSRPSAEHAPSAPPLPVAPAPAPAPVPAPAPPAAGGDAFDDAATCVICLSAPRVAGFLHGGTVHNCVCGDCAKEFKANMARQREVRCPLCRQPVEQVIAVF